LGGDGNGSGSWRRRRPNRLHQRKRRGFDALAVIGDLDLIDRRWQEVEIDPVGGQHRQNDLGELENVGSSLRHASDSHDSRESAKTKMSYGLQVLNAVVLRWPKAFHCRGDAKGGRPKNKGPAGAKSAGEPSMTLSCGPSGLPYEQA
jgi:hypothetical protein